MTAQRGLAPLPPSWPRWVLRLSLTLAASLLLSQSITAGLFLADFVPEGQRWVHVDIAGPAFTDKAYGYTPKGGTGAGVRTLVALAEDMAVGRRGR